MSWIQRNIVAIFMLGLLSMGGTILYFTMQSDMNTLHAQQVKITQLENEIKALKEQGTNQQAEMKQQVVGQSIERIKPDTEKAQSLMQAAATWSDAEGYIAAREKVSRQFGLDEKSQFMGTFLPGEEAGAFRKDGSGKLHFAYPGANSRLKDFTTTLVGIDKQSRDKWTYFGTASMETKAPNSGRVERQIAVQYTIDGDGKFVDVLAYPSNTAPKLSN